MDDEPVSECWAVSALEAACCVNGAASRKAGFFSAARVNVKQHKVAISIAESARAARPAGLNFAIMMTLLLISCLWLMIGARLGQNPESEKPSSNLTSVLP